MNERDSEQVARMFRERGGYALTAERGRGGRDSDQHLFGPGPGGTKGDRENGDDGQVPPDQAACRLWVSRLHGSIAGRRVVADDPASRPGGRHTEIPSGGRICGHDPAAPDRAPDGRRAVFDRGCRHRGGVAEHHPRPGSGAAAGDRVRQHHAGMQHEVHVLHRAVHPRRRTRAADRGHRR